MKALAFSGGKDSMACLHLLRDSLDCAIYVDTGFSYPETLELVSYANSIVPVHIVKSERNGEGLPSDIVPIDWTTLGQQIAGKKSVKVQSYLGCCYESISAPIIKKAQELGVTELVYGQRNDENRKAPSRDGDVVFGMIRRHPIENWTADEVVAYLATKMEIPAHYAIKHSSLDCYDCTAYRKDSTDRIEWMRAEHPDLYQRYASRATLLDSALKEAM